MKHNEERRVREPLIHLTRRGSIRPLQAWGIRIAAAALGLLSDPVPPGDFGAKMAFSEKTKALAEAFREGAGSLRCADMRPEDLEARKAVCGGYIRLGVKLAAEALMK